MASDSKPFMEFEVLDANGFVLRTTNLPLCNYLCAKLYPFIQCQWMGSQHDVQSIQVLITKDHERTHQWLEGYFKCSDSSTLATYTRDYPFIAKPGHPQMTDEKWLRLRPQLKISFSILQPYPAPAAYMAVDILFRLQPRDNQRTLEAVQLVSDYYQLDINVADSAKHFNLDFKVGWRDRMFRRLKGVFETPHWLRHTDPAEVYEDYVSVFDDHKNYPQESIPETHTHYLGQTITWPLLQT